MLDREGLQREALRVYRRYQVEVVERLRLCPWAARARQQGQVQVRVLFGNPPALGTVLAEIERLQRDSRIEVGLLLFPELACTRPWFERFAANVREADAARHEGGATPTAIAEFHPEAEADASTPARLIPLLRRTPDPTLQLVRRAALERVRLGEPGGTTFIDPEALELSMPIEDHTAPLHDRVARANQQAVQRLGLERFVALVDDIRSDRQRAYAALEHGTG